MDGGRINSGGSKSLVYQLAGRYNRDVVAMAGDVLDGTGDTGLAGVGILDRVDGANPFYIAAAE